MDCREASKHKRISTRWNWPSRLVCHMMSRRMPCTTAQATTRPSHVRGNPRESTTRAPTSWEPASPASLRRASSSVTPRCPVATSISSRRETSPAVPATVRARLWASPCAAVARWTTTSRSCGTSTAPSRPSKRRASASSTSTTGSTRMTPTTHSAVRRRTAARMPTPTRSSDSPTRPARRSPSSS